jgi:AraC family transcriptional regulator
LKQAFRAGKFYGATRKEIRTPAFDFAEVEDYDNIEVPLHTHESAHFLFVVKGTYEATIKDKKRFFSSSSIIYYPAGTTHRDRFCEREERRFLTVSLTSETNKKLHNEIKFVDHSVDFNNPEISCLGKRIYREIQAPDGLSSIVLDCLANELLVYSARDSENSAKPPAWLKTARELIRDRCTEPVSVAEVAAAVAVHPLHLARSFRRYFGCSPGEFLRSSRIEFASNLLLNSKKTLAEIALISGFADQSRFTHSFKQIVGTTPAKFRQLHEA